MNDVVKIEKYNEVYIKIDTEAGIKEELKNYFAFRPSGYQFNPRYKNRVWDGYIYLFNPWKPLLYTGLIEHLKKFCKDRNYDIIIPEEINSRVDIPDNYVEELSIKIKAKLKPRDYQIEYVLNALRNNRSLSLSPTSSGKSFIIYLIQQHYWHTYRYRTLIIVPTISLVHQMAGDFIDYGCDSNDVYKIQSGVDKNTSAPVTISTWQSLVKQPKEWFNQFQVVLGDEAHLFQAKSLINIMEKLTQAPFRHGFTGTLSSDSRINKLVLEGLFGPIRRYITTKELIDRGTIADFKVKALILCHDEETKKLFSDAIKPLKKAQRYAAERIFIFNHDKRNIFIRNLVWSLKDQNNLILFDQIENHGKILEPLLQKEDRILHFIHGGVSGEERERIRKIVENDPIKRHDILASYGVFSTGINLKRIDNAIFASGYKSEIKVLQSIGRTLRKGNGSDSATLYDIADDLSTKSFTNYTLQHFRSRIDIYYAEQFPVKIYSIDI
jgi:superfamily II DNA or RNA helicase